MKKRLLALILSAVLIVASAAGCGKVKPTEAPRVRSVLQQAQSMSLEELCLRAAAELRGQSFRAAGPAQGGEAALDAFAAYLRELDPELRAELHWEQSEQAPLIESLAAEAAQTEGSLSVVLLPYSAGLEDRLLQTGVLDSFFPLAWRQSVDPEGLRWTRCLPLWINSRVFLYNNAGSFAPENLWDFVGKDRRGLSIDIDALAAEKNFLYMLTAPEYAARVREAFELLPLAERNRLTPVVDSLRPDAEDLGLGEDGPYVLAWLQLWIGSYEAMEDDSRICAALARRDGADRFGLTSYAQLKTVAKTAALSAKRVDVAACREQYRGVGGFGSCDYLLIPDNAPLPWTACAFLAYCTCTVDGFRAWGAEGLLSPNPEVQLALENSSQALGSIVIPDKNERGLSWWLSEGGLVLENPSYCASAALSVGSWIDVQRKAP